MDKTNNIGKRIKLLREKQGLNQSSFAQMLGYKQNSQLSSIESGRSLPTISILEKIAENLNADLHWLITGQSAPTIQQERRDYIKALNMANKALYDTVARHFKDIENARKIIDPIEEKLSEGQELTDVEKADLDWYKPQIGFMEHLLQQASDEQQWAAQAMNEALKKNKQDSK